MNFENSARHYVHNVVMIISNGTKKFRNRWIEALLDEFEKAGILEELKNSMKQRNKKKELPQSK